MYENAAYAGQMMRSEQMKDVLVSEAAAQHGLPHQVIQEFVRQEGGLPQELQGTGAQAQAFFADDATRQLQGQQIERMRQQQGIDQAAAIHAAAVGTPHQPPDSIAGPDGARGRFLPKLARAAGASWHAHAPWPDAAQL